MKNFPLIAGVVTLLIVLAGALLFSRGNSAKEPSLTPPPLPESYEYFWSTACSHCKIVNEFIENWENKDKINLEKMEVSIKENSDLLNQRANFCNLANNQRGIPFLFTPDGQCVAGDTSIINFFEQMEFEE